MPNGQNVRRAVQEARALIGRAPGIPPQLEKLVTHPRNRRVHFRRTTTHKDAVTGRSVSHKAFLVDKNLCFDGITKPLKQVFWTSYAAPSVKDAVRASSSRASGGCHGGGCGKEHGVRVHEGLERLIRAVHGKLKRNNGTPTVAHVDPCAYRILCALVKRRIVPLVAEFAIFDEYSGLATAIDCVAWDVDGAGLVAVEVKTGHVGQTNYSSVLRNAHFRAPMEAVPDSALNRAATQLLMSMLIVARRYGVQFDRGIILRPLSEKNQVQLYEMPEWTLVEAMQQNMYAQLRSFATSGANARRVMKRTCFGARQRVSLERQEGQQLIREMQPDPSASVFWTPPPRTRRESQPAPVRSDTATVDLSGLVKAVAPAPQMQPSSVSKVPAKPQLVRRSDLSWRAEVNQVPGRHTE